jgi:monofunctional biosynthetic peptidoglycan transglycosylase
LHAVIAAEDARFYSHHGFDWKEMRASVDKALDGGKPRGASTITQQLVRNLFLSTQPSLIRKGLEMSIVPLAEAILGKHRILELYVNVIEWGPGVYGIEAAARYYFRTEAASLNREQGAELAALLPAPLHRRPGQVEWYVARIRLRMRELGW